MSRFTFLGRLVQGDPVKAQPQEKDDKTGALKFLKNGEPACPFYVAVAIEKNPANRFHIEGVPSFESQRELIDQLARTAWPQFFGQRAAQGPQFGANLPADCTNPQFANKVIDGDGFDSKGKPFSSNEGWGGCWIIKVNSYYAPQVQEWRDDQVDGRGATMKADWYPVEKTGRTIKLGDYVSVSGTCESNKSTQTPGMYMNLDMVGFEKEGDLIVSKAAVDATQALGARGGTPNAGAAGAGTTSSGAAGGQTSQTASGGSYSGYRQTTDDAPPPPGDDTPPPPSGPTMSAKAGGKSFQSFIDKGWTEAQLREHGYLA